MRSRPTISEQGDDWYESEESTGDGLVSELQRMRRRFAVRPLPVLILAALVTAGVTYKVITKERLLHSEIVLAMTEGTMASERMGIPADQLREYVTSVLMSDKNMLELIEKRNLYPLRKRLGPQFALEELWEQLEVEIWKNSFIYYHSEDQYARKSARIGITFKDSDPDKAYSVARDIAAIVIATHDVERQKITSAVVREVRAAHDSLKKQLEDLALAIAVKQTAMATARKESKGALAAALHVELAALDQQVKQAEDQMHLISQSNESIADQISAAGLDVNLAIVEERRPERPVQWSFVLVLVVVVVGTGALIGSAMFVGAFDSRIHDTDDVERLGLPVLGHVPAFAGDHVGSLRARGVHRAHAR